MSTDNSKERADDRTKQAHEEAERLMSRGKTGGRSIQLPPRVDRESIAPSNYMPQGNMENTIPLLKSSRPPISSNKSITLPPRMLSDYMITSISESNQYRDDVQPLESGMWFDT